MISLMSKCIRWVVVCSTAPLMMLSAHAAVLAVEHFDYGDSDKNQLGSANGGSGWATAWNADNTAGGALMHYKALGLSHPGLGSAGGSVATRSDWDSRSFRTLSGTYGNDGDTIWVRFLVENLGTASAWAGLGLYSGTSEKLFLGQRSGQSVWGVSGGSSSDTSVPVTTSSMILAKIEFASGNESVSMWALTGAMPDTEIGLGAPMASISATSFTFDRVRIAGATGSPTAFDELMIVSDFDDFAAVPEANTLAYLLFGIFALLLKRIRS